MTGTVAWFVIPPLWEGGLESPFSRLMLWLWPTRYCVRDEWGRPSNYFRKQMKSCNKRPLGSRPLKQICFLP